MVRTINKVFEGAADLAGEDIPRACRIPETEDRVLRCAERLYAFGDDRELAGCRGAMDALQEKVGSLYPHDSGPRRTKWEETLHRLGVALGWRGQDDLTEGRWIAAQLLQTARVYFGDTGAEERDEEGLPTYRQADALCRAIRIYRGWLLRMVKQLPERQ